MSYIKISMKSFLRKNLNNKALLLCVSLLILLPSLLYNLSGSVMKEINSSQRDVFGAFSDIVYTPTYSADSLDDINEETTAFLNNFNFFQKGVISTVYSEQISNSRFINVGYADDTALNLGQIKLIDGNFPINADEIAITEGLTHFWECKSGDIIEIAGSKYTISGIVQDYGRLWVRGIEQDEQNIYPINVFMTKQSTEILLSKTHTLTTQILLTKSNDNIINQVSSPYHYENINLSNLLTFTIPVSFLVIDFILSFFVIGFILLLGRKRTQKRISAYYCLGLYEKNIFGILCFERLLSVIFGIILGFAGSVALTHILLYGLSKNIGRKFIFLFDYANLIPFAVIFWAITSFVVFLFTAHEIDQSMDILTADSKPKFRKINYTGKFSLGKFLLKNNISSYFILTLLAAFSFSLISYGIFYKNYFTQDISEAPDGTLPRDYDFQYIAYAPSSTPWQDKDDPIMFFTDTLEKLGADENFITQLKSESMTDSIKAYKENNKYFTIMKPTQIDNYLDGWDFEYDGKYGSQFRYFNNFLRISEKFGYSKSDVLVQSEILGYPEEVLQQLSGSIVEGSINIDKIRSGEEVILRVPAYILENYDNNAVARSPIVYTADNAVNFEAYTVGDEITLTSLHTDEMINGAVPLSYLNKFERKDITVKIGAIIRSTDGIMYSFREQQALTFLTVNEAFEALDITALYSIVSVYTKPNYSDNELTNRYVELSAQVPSMQFQNWIIDTKTYKVFNLMISVYVFVLIVILLLTTFAILSSQQLNLTRFSFKTYSLFRLNGMKLNQIVMSSFTHSNVAVLIGTLIGIPISVFIIIFFGIGKALDSFDTFLYYFPLETFIYILISIVIIWAISIVPSVIELHKNSDNILNGIAEE